jgi:hypothetical protein
MRDPADSFQIDESLHWRHVEGEVLALDVSSSRYLSINSSGAVLWPLLADGASVGELADALQQRWGLASHRARADVEAFLDRLDSEGLIRRRG